MQAKQTHGESKNEFFKLIPISYKPKKHTENAKTNSKTYTYFLQAKETHEELKNDFFKLIPISYKPKKHTENSKTNSPNLYLFLTSQRNTGRMQKRYLPRYTYFLQARETH